MIVGDDREETKEITSNIEGHVRFSGGASEDVRDRQFGNQLSSYYDEVIDVICGSDSIWIFGLGEAKGELEKRLVSKEMGGRIVSVETVDKMTDRQISAKVRGTMAKAEKI